VTIMHTESQPKPPCVAAAFLRALALLLTACLALPADGGEHSMKCYSDGFDRDGDGYAGLTAADARTAYQMITWNGSLRLHCPDGYVRAIGDCNDRDPEVHPNHAEIGLNGRDDDCDGVVDEPTFAAARASTSSAFWFEIALNSQILVDHAQALFAQVSYASLADSANLLQTAKIAVHPADRRQTVEVAVSNLSPVTVYRAQVAFFTRDAAGNYQPIGPTLGDDDWYYAMTDGRDAETRTRAAIVQRGLAEYRQSNEGKVGYRGTQDRDGTRYGAGRNEAWCTEFYVWVTKVKLRGIAGRDSWDEMIDYFRAAGSFLPAADLARRAVPADYLVMDSDGDGKKNHSGMFLAYESAQGRAWTLEGNFGNAVRVWTRKSEIQGIGHLTPELLKNIVSPPPPAVGVVMPPECRGIQERIDALDLDLERVQARLAGASGPGKSSLLARIDDLNRRRDAAKRDYRQCLDDALRASRQR
jgi:hypothetical protein